MGLGDGRYGKLLLTLATTDLLVLDHFGLALFSDTERHDLLEILEEATAGAPLSSPAIFPSPVGILRWGDPTLTDAILDRLVHNAYKLELSGESLRKGRAEIEEAKGV